MFSDLQRSALLDFAKAVIKNRLDGSAYAEPDDPAFTAKRGIFVSLHIHGELRGCIGYIFPYMSLVDSVKEMALAAAFRDPRFKPLTQAEFNDLQIEISILSELIPVHSNAEIVIGRDGLYIDHPSGSGLLLPQVALEWNWDVPEFLRHLEQKAGLKACAHQDPETDLYRFEAEIFSA
jgi:AmmeMemoRadiSam system protein A